MTYSLPDYNIDDFTLSTFYDYYYGDDLLIGAYDYNDVVGIMVGMGDSAAVTRRAARRSDPTRFNSFRTFTSAA